MSKREQAMKSHEKLIQVAARLARGAFQHVEDDDVRREHQEAAITVRDAADALLRMVSDDKEATW